MAGRWVVLTQWCCAGGEGHANTG